MCPRSRLVGLEVFHLHGVKWMDWIPEWQQRGEDKTDIDKLFSFIEACHHLKEVSLSVVGLDHSMDDLERAVDGLALEHLSLCVDKYMPLQQHKFPQKVVNIKDVGQSIANIIQKSSDTLRVFRMQHVRLTREEDVLDLCRALSGCQSLEVLKLHDVIKKDMRLSDGFSLRIGDIVLPSQLHSLEVPDDLGGLTLQPLCLKHLTIDGTCVTHVHQAANLKALTIHDELHVDIKCFPSLERLDIHIDICPEDEESFMGVGKDIGRCHALRSVRLRLFNNTWDISSGYLVKGCRNCPYLEELTCYVSTQEEVTILAESLKYWPRLKSLEVTFVADDYSNTPIIEQLTLCPSLTHLRLSEIETNITTLGAIINQGALRRLEVLLLAYSDEDACTPDSFWGLFTALKQCTRIRRVQIGGLRALDNNDTQINFARDFSIGDGFAMRYIFECEDNDEDPILAFFGWSICGKR